MNSVVHFEMPYDDQARMSKFYEQAFGWQTRALGEAVGSITDAIERVRRAGGAVLGEPMEIPGVGQYVSFTDTEGNRVSMLQPAPRG